MLATFAAIVGRTLKADDGPDSFNVLDALTGDPAEPMPALRRRRIPGHFRFERLSGRHLRLS